MSSQFSDFETIEVDLGNDGGTPDFVISGREEIGFSGVGPLWTQLRIQFTGELLTYPRQCLQGECSAWLHAHFLSPNSLPEQTQDQVWANPATYVDLVVAKAGIFPRGAPPTLEVNFPTGVSYLPTRTQVGSDLFYGWLEVLSTNMADGDHNDAFIITRFGIADTPGIMIQMGEE